MTWTTGIRRGVAVAARRFDRRWPGSTDRHGLTTAFAYLLLLAISAGSTRSEPPSPTPARTAKGTQAFAPGVRIDWARRRVEVDARVVLRKGPLELLACSPHTHEHESIFVVDARPLRVYQAMGLIGLEPGSPVHFDEASAQWRPPVGARLDMAVRWGPEDSTLIPVERLLRRTGNQDGPADVRWVFSGSRRSAAGRFLADLDGTVICVVDFGSALISIGAMHTADNAQLWLEANTDAIPLVGTACTLLIAAHEASANGLRVVVEVDGTLIVEAEPVSMAQLVERLKRNPLGRDKVVVQLEPADGVGTEKLDALVRQLVEAGLPRGAIAVDTTGAP